MAIRADENVLRFEVAVNDARRMQALHAFDYFRSIETGTIAAQPSPTCKLRRKVSSRMEVL